METEEHLSRRARKARKGILDAASVALQNEGARVFVRWIIDRAGLFSPATDNTSEGRRELGLEIVGLLNEIDPYEFVRLMKESADDVVRKRNEARKRQKDADDGDT